MQIHSPACTALSLVQDYEIALVLDMINASFVTQRGIGRIAYFYHIHILSLAFAQAFAKHCSERLPVEGYRIVHSRGLELFSPVIVFS